MPCDGFDDDRSGDWFDDSTELPPKLAALAEQLCDDAQALARRYPPRNEQALRPFQAIEQPAIAQPLSRRLITAGGLAATILVTIVAWQAAFRGDPEMPLVPAAMTVEHTGRVARAVDDRKHDAFDGDVQPIGNILQGLSAAEQEAVLDLFENGAEHGASLSI